MHISSASYKDQQGVMIDTGILEAVILPGRGANLASLIYKPAGKQLLSQRPGTCYQVQPYAGNYVAAENAGMDDMFPTIDACVCEQFPWQGVQLPDHGEVWSLPWQAEPDDDGLSLRVHGVRLPYTLEKRFSAPDPSVIKIEYRLTNHTAFEFDYLWAAHAMFASEEGAEVVVPQGLDRFTTTFSNSPALGRYGDQFAWPLATLSDGSQRDMRWMRSKQAGEVYKFYFHGKLREGWCAARFHQSGIAIGLSWPQEAVPYLALLPNEGGWDDACSLYFEPSTCTFDRPDFGRYHGEVARLGPNAAHSWYLNISVTPNLDFTRVTPQGFFA